ncbi:MAG TPA: HlyU family transcriptional regulator [Hyphomicrobiaceae bacterium]|nr:HlyU family transcriptional regulator [Hyphomicrobiaceae bacterium]
MLSAIKTAWSRLAGGAGAASNGPAIPPVEYNGYRIRPAPYLSNNQYQTAGSIEKDTPEGVKEHKFIRADTYANRDDAITFTIAKAKQIIDQQGDRIFTSSGIR